MNNNEFLLEMGNYFRVHDNHDCIELETWTDGGVNMFIVIDKESNKSYLDQFENYVNDFDVDEEIDVHREDSLYRSHFSHKRSVNDFEAYENWLQSILDKLD